ncbi:MAG: chloride channel protein, partial [Bacteroidaceae bacterium]|nr:chloride channel protein [Bacteroidaceae bacterium]
MNHRKLIAFLLRWRRRNLSDRNFVLLISLLVGVFTALAGLLLKWLIEQIEVLLTHEFAATSSNWLYLVYPVVGVWLTMLFIRYIVRDDIGHGVTKILFAIARKQSR